MKKILTIMLVFILAFTLFVGCGEKEQTEPVKEETQKEEATEESKEEAKEEVKTVKVTDFAGREVEFDKVPEKVVSLHSSYGDLWYAAGGELIGIIDTKILPEKAKDLPKVGKMSAVNVEALLALQPDFVILLGGYEKHEKLIPILESNNIKVYACKYDNFEQMAKIYKDFAMISGNENLYDEKIVPMKEEIEKMTGEKKDFSYLLLLSTSKNIRTKDDNITAEIIDNLGGKNITKDYKIADEESKQFSFEKILEANPDYIFIQTMGSVDKAKARLEEDIYSNPAWASLKAVKEGHFYYLPKDLFLYKPNMKFVDAYQYMADILEGKISASEQ